MSGKKRKTNISVKNKQGKLYKYEKEQNKRGRGHFAEVLNHLEPNEQANTLEADDDLEIDPEEP